MIIYNFCLWLTVVVRVLSWIIIQINSLYFIISNYRVFIKPCYICHVFRYQIEKLLKIQNRISNFIILFKILPFSYLLKWTWTGINSSRPIFKPVKSPMESLKIFKGIKTRKIRCLEMYIIRKITSLGSGVSLFQCLLCNSFRVNVTQFSKRSSSEKTTKSDPKSA